MTASQSPELLGAASTGTRATTQLAANRESRTLRKNGLAVRTWLQAVTLLGLLHSAAAQIPQVEQLPEPSQAQQPSLQPAAIQSKPDHPSPVRGKPWEPLTVDSGVCERPYPSHSRTLNVPSYYTKRPPVAGDYVVIEYNASQDPTDPTHNLTSWTDYDQTFGQIIRPNGSFLPVVYAKEKIAVRVCGLKFTDVLTVTTAPNGVPEGGADIRGASPITPVASLTSTLDTLQSGEPTGGTTTLPGLGLNAPAALPSLAIPGITPGALGPEDQTPGKFPSYTPATLTASGKQVALLLYGVLKNTKEISTLIDRTFGLPYDSDAQNQHAGYYLNLSRTDYSRLLERMDKSKSAPGSVNGVTYSLEQILPGVRTDSTDHTNFPAFDKHLTDVQNVNAQISTLASALSSQAFASNALVLLNNYSALTGILDLAKLGTDQTNCQISQPLLQPPDFRVLSKDDLGKITFDTFANWTSSQVLLLPESQILLLPDTNGLREKLRSLKKELVRLGFKAVPEKSPTGDKPLCSVFEKQKITDFWNSFIGQVAFLLCSENKKCVTRCNGDPTCIMSFVGKSETDEFEGSAGKALIDLNDHLDVLRDKLRKIDKGATELYDLMNEWQFNSSLEETDLLPPLTTNASVRISIAVQRGYTPFTLANPGGTITPAVTANTVPTTVTAASTSTPAHSVKTILVEVHRVANFNLMGGTMFIHIPTASYGLQASPTPATLDQANTGYDIETCGGQQTLVLAASPAPTYSCVVQTQQTQWQLAAMAGLVWFPWGHDYFPRHSGYQNFGRNLLPSLLLATSVSSLGNSMGGVNWEPISGLDFYAGLGSAHKTSLPSGLTVNTALPSGATLTTLTQEHAGFTVGVGFDLNVIMTLFSSKTTSVASAP